MPDIVQLVEMDNKTDGVQHQFLYITCFFRALAWNSIKIIVIWESVVPFVVEANP